MFSLSPIHVGFLDIFPLIFLWVSSLPLTSKKFHGIQSKAGVSKFHSLQNRVVAIFVGSKLHEHYSNFEF